MPSNKNAYMKKYWSEHPEKYEEHKKRTIENNREWRKDNKEKTKQYGLKCRLKLKMEVYFLLGNKCVHCGFSDIRALQIDHVNGNGKSETSKYRSCYSYYKKVLEAIKAGSKDYQLLCANCNWIKRCECKEYR